MSLKRGDKITINVEYMFGKVGKEIVTVVAIVPRKGFRDVLLSNGRTLKAI